MKNIYLKLEEIVTNSIMSYPLATFSITYFVFSVMRLQYDMQPLLLIGIFLASILVVLFSRSKINSFMSLVLAFAIFGGIFITGFSVKETEGIIDDFDGKMASVTGSIVSVPEVYGNKQSFFLEADEIVSDNIWRKDKTKLYVTLNSKAPLCYGDRISFNGELVRSDGNELMVQTYYLAKNVSLKASGVILTGYERSVFPYNIVPAIKNYIVDIGDKFFSGQTAMLFKALTAGDKSSFSRELTNNLTRSGLSHIACVSGLHVSILGMAVYNLLRHKRIAGCIITVAFIILFSVVTGASPSTVRAAIMFIIYLLSKILIKRNHSFTALAFSAMLLSVNNPYVVYDWGFILSFLSVLGIEIFANDFSRWLRFLPKMLRESIAVTLGAQLVTFPALTVMFGEISAYSVLANIVVSSFFVYTMYLCLSFVIVSFVPFVNVVYSAVCGLFVDGVCTVANLFSDLPYAMVSIESMSAVSIFCYYVFVVLFVFRKEISEYFIAIVLFICAGLIMISNIFMPSAVESYELLESSVLYKSENASYMVTRDALDTVEDRIGCFSAKIELDAIIVDGEVSEQADGMIGIKQLTGCERVYVCEKYKNKDFENIVTRSGIEIIYYNENEKEKIIDEISGG